MKKLIIVLGFLLPVVLTTGQTKKEIDDLMTLLNSDEYHIQDSLIWVDLLPLKQKSDSLEIVGEMAIKSGDNKIIPDLMKKYIGCTKNKLNVLSKYPDYVCSARYLLQLVMNEKDGENRAPKIGSLDDYEKVYNRFSNDVKSSYYGKGLKILFENEIPKIGDIAPDLDFYTINGELFKLSDYTGKYVLVKSYLSGCYGWSIEHPMINEVYQILDKNEIVVIGVGIDNKDDWIDNIKENSFDWISAFQPIGGKMTVIYNINSNSRNVLIDPDGTIIDMDIPIQNGQLYTRLEKAMNN